MPNKIDLIGHVYGRLEVIAEAEKRGTATMWLCRCSCGNEKVIAAGSIRKGASKSCGCLHKESSATNGKRSTVHGMKGTPTYESWRSMRKRCLYTKDQAYSRYGGAGIKVCDRWAKSFAAFLEDMGERPEGTSIDRIDPSGNYEPSNCRWADRKTQNRNKKNTVKVFFLGRYWPVIDIAERTGVNCSTLAKRIRNGERIESALRHSARSKASTVCL